MADNARADPAPGRTGHNDYASASASRISTATATPADLGIHDDFNDHKRLEMNLSGRIDDGVTPPAGKADGEEADDAELYRHTFGRSQGSNISLNALPPSVMSQERTRTTTDKQREVYSSSASPRARHSSPNFSEDETEARDVYTTSLTPRKAKRRSLPRSDAPASPKSSNFGMLDFGARERASADSRSSDIGQEQLPPHAENFQTASGDSQRKYRSNERALEAQNRQEKFPLVVAEEEFLHPSSNVADRQQRLTLRPGIPRRSSSQSRRRSTPAKAASPALAGAGSHLRVNSASQQPSPHTRKGNVTFRNRALSEPVSSQNLNALYALAKLSKEEPAQAQERLTAAPGGEEDRPLPSRSRPLSVPASAAVVARNLDKRQSAGARSSGIASSGVMPWDPAQSTALSLRQATGEGALDSHAKPYDGEAERPIVGHGTLLQDRAQARYHLSALSAMRARIPGNPRVDLKALQYTSWLPRLHHTLLALILYAHVLATIFFDYNSLYSIVQVALYPDSTGSSAAWWIASGIYAAALIVWFVGVIVIWEFIIQYRRRWANTRPFVLPIYTSAASFNLSAIRSMSLYSLLFRARLSADRRDFAIETFWFYSQNWPTVLTLLPRGIILTVFLVLYNPYSSTSASSLPSQGRDAVYFDTETARLTNFSFIVLLINVAWMAWRTMILLLSYSGLLITLGPQALYRREKTMYDWHDSEGSLTPLPGAISSARRKETKAEYGSNTQDYRYSTVDTPQDEGEAGLSTAPSHGQQRSSTIATSTPHGWSVRLPDWAWRGRAEERIKALLLQSSVYDAGSKAKAKDWLHSPEAGRDLEAQETRAMLGEGGDQTLMAERPNLRSATVQTVYSGELGDFEMVPTRPWMAEEAEPRASSSSRGSASFDRLRTQPRLVVTNSESPLPPTTGSTRSPPSLASSVGKVAKGKDRQSHVSDSSDPSLSDSPPFASRAGSRPISGITMSTVSEATIRPSSLYANQAPEQQVYPFPVHEDQATTEPEETKRSRGRETSETFSIATPAGLDNASPGFGAATSSSGGRKRRTSSSLSSLSESLGFTRSNKNSDQIEQGNVGDSRERMPVSGKGEGAWWSNWMRTKPARAATAASISSDDPNNAEVLLEDDEAAGEEGPTDFPPPADSERGSMRTHETATSEDSEERRLWSQFPEQSRRYPPGLIALEMEQRRLLQEEERRRVEENSPAQIERDDQGSSSLYENKRDAEDSPRKSGEGLVPIKEESWSSSLDSASNESH